MSGTLDAPRRALADRYRIERELGAGGMATVYLAHDVRHDRQVAIKVLHEDLGATLGPERFLAEIKTTAKLQHPHILPLLDSGSVGGLLYYVMPFVEGETLRARLNRETQLPVEDAVRIAREVADALGFAHGHGIVHRDIKPENILLQGGHALVADFGIALAVQQAGGTRLTQTGLSLGTPQYMSPEQAMGDRTVDHRSDIYALGAVTYEMLTGDPPFTGSSVQAIVAKVLSSEPERLTTTRRTIPPNVEAAVLTALAKLPADRFTEASDFVRALQTTATTAMHTATGGVAVGSRSARRAWVITVVASLTAISAIGYASMRSTASNSPRGMRHVSIILPDSAPLAEGSAAGPQFALTRGGDTLVYVSSHDSSSGISVRSLRNDATRRLPGTDGAEALWLSPDGAWVAFISRCGSTCTLSKTHLDGSGLVTLASDLPYPCCGGDWADAGRLVFSVLDGSSIAVASPDGDPLRYVAVQGGFISSQPRSVPGTSWVVSSIEVGEPRNPNLGTFRAIGLVSMDDGSVFAVNPRGRVRADSSTLDDWVLGHAPYPLSRQELLFFMSDGTGMLMRFDGQLQRTLGPPTAVLSGVRWVGGPGGRAMLSVGAEGSLVYSGGTGGFGARLVFVHPGNRVETLSLPATPFGEPRLSRDGTRILSAVYPPGAPAEMRVYDLIRGTSEKIPVRSLLAYGGWSFDGLSVIHGSPSGFVVRRQVANLNVADSIPFAGYASDANASGDVLVNRYRFALRPGQWLVPWGQPDKARVLDPFPVNNGTRFSPDGRAIAFTNAESGRYDVYVAPIDRPQARRRVIEGSASVAWSNDGRQVFAIKPPDIVAVNVTRSGGGFVADKPRVVFSAPWVRETAGMGISVAPDGRILLLQGSPRSTATRVEMVLEWLPSIIGSAESKR